MADLRHAIPSVAHLVYHRFMPPLPGRRRTIVESLTVGPCRVDPGEQDLVRRSFWEESSHSGEPPDAKPRTEIGCAADLDRWVIATEGGPRVLWSSPTYASRVTLVWALAAMQRLGARTTKTWWVDAIVEPHRAELETDHVALSPENLRHAWAARRTKLDSALLEEAAHAWAAYASETPALIAAVLRKPKTPPVTRARLRHYAAALPQLRDGVLHLSALDRALFSELKRGARSIAHALGDVLISWVGSQRPDSVLFDRIASWTQTDPPAIELDGDGVRLSAMRGVLTPYGERLLSSGLAHPSEAPPFWVGGYLAYRDPIWSATEHKGFWTLDPWPRGRTG
jgi:hypothetical protein